MHPPKPAPIGMNAGHRISVLLSAEEIAARIAALGEQISREYAGETLVLVGVLKGSIIFLSDLIRHLHIPVQTEFLGVTSYGDDTVSSGEVKVTADLTRPVHNQHILVVEDIIDTGLTLAYILRTLAARNPASLRVCCLLDKRERRQIEIEADYVGFTIPNRFVVGYGLDYQGLLRNLPYVGVLHLEEDPHEHDR